MKDRSKKSLSITENWKRRELLWKTKSFFGEEDWEVMLQDGERGDIKVGEEFGERRRG